MPHNAQIEAILEAWFELENCEPTNKHAAHKKLNELLDAAIGTTNFSRAQVLDYLFPRFKELKAKRWKEFKVSVAQSSGATPN